MRGRAVLSQMGNVDRAEAANGGVRLELGAHMGGLV